jgi:hypothetical protein
LQGTAGDREAMMRLGSNILAINPILEAFGNAATVCFLHFVKSGSKRYIHQVKNHNSSRFGKYLEVMFNDDFQVSVPSFSLGVFSAPYNANRTGDWVQHFRVSAREKPRCGARYKREQLSHLLLCHGQRRQERQQLW